MSYQFSFRVAFQPGVRSVFDTAAHERIAELEEAQRQALINMGVIVVAPDGAEVHPKNCTCLGCATR